MSDTKPDCYACRWRRPIPGDAHSSCAHPTMAPALDSPEGEYFQLMGKAAGAIGPLHHPDAIMVKGHPHGIRSGWFNHPFNFDPTWLLECNGFEPKETL